MLERRRSEATAVSIAWMNEEPNSARSPRRLPRLPEPTLPERLGEATRAAGSAVLGAAVPVLGEGLAEFFGSYFPSMRKRREDAWVNELRTMVNDLAKHAVRIEDLKDNDAFHDIVCATSLVAMRTHLDDKRTALRNALVNAALPGAPSSVKQHLFVNLVDELSELHLHVLDLLFSPEAWFTARNSTLPVHRGPTGMAFDRSTSEARLEAVLQKAFPQYANEMPLVELVLADLQQRGLTQERDRVDTRPLDLMTWCGQHRSFTSPLGAEFIRFIRQPPSPAQG